jgi:hypothetical protein
MQAEAASVFSPVPQSPEALLAAPIPWTDRHLGAENLKTLLLARLPVEPTGRDLLSLFEHLGVRSVRQSDMIQGRVSARGRFSLTPAFWSITALIDPETDRLTSLSVQYRSNI